jgi:diaminopimelate decarboxylase
MFLLSEEELLIESNLNMNQNYVSEKKNIISKINKTFKTDIDDARVSARINIGFQEATRFLISNGYKPAKYGFGPYGMVNKLNFYKKINDECTSVIHLEEAGGFTPKVILIFNVRKSSKKDTYRY